MYKEKVNILKKKTVLIILVIFICFVTGILVNDIQQKIASHQVKTTSDKSLASTSLGKNKSEINSTKINSNNVAPVDNANAGESKYTTGNEVSKGAISNDNNSSKNAQNNGIGENGNTQADRSEKQNNEQVNSAVNNEQSNTAVNKEQANFIIIDNENSSKNYSSHENLTGMSVADITIKVLRRQGIYFQYTNSIMGIYISDINHEHEKSKGPNSGWVYYVNGIKSSVGASDYKLNAGDKIEWQFWADALNN